ncbi:N-acetylneuraminate synthase [Prochlorococcus marinus]|uniref:N-acetylneuraminate synthase n=1 Tax=Prochlorococcus marinus TaxID=1219 RepID=UPI0039B09356
MKVKIIAEAGVNHNGDLNIAFQLIEAAKKCGADYIKFQTFKANQLSTNIAPKAEYQEKNTHQIESQLDMLKKLELSDIDFQKLYLHCKKIGIGFLSSGFSPKDLEFLDNFKMDFIKIPSGEITNLLLLESVAKLGKKSKVILSTGMSKLGEIEEAINVLTSGEINRNKITLLHCTTEYPAPLDSVNLYAINTLRNAFGCEVGYSDHTKGISVAIAAVAMGATIIEKHFTLNTNLEGPDHKASLDIKEFGSMVASIRDITLSFGTPIKQLTSVEEKNIHVARKSLVAIKNISAGEIFTRDNLGCKRPGTGISPMRYYDFLNISSTKEYKPDQLIEEQ